MSDLFDYSVLFVAVLGGGCYLVWRTRSIALRVVLAVLAAGLMSCAHASPYAVARNVIGQRPEVPDSLFSTGSPEYAWYATGVHRLQLEITKVDGSMWPERTSGMLTLLFLALVPPRRRIAQSEIPTGSDAPAA